MNKYVTAMVVVDDLGVFNTATTEVDNLGCFVTRNMDSFFEIDFGAMNADSRQAILVSLHSNEALSSANFRELSNDRSVMVLQLIKS